MLQKFASPNLKILEIFGKSDLCQTLKKSIHVFGSSCGKNETAIQILGFASTLKHPIQNFGSPRAFDRSSIKIRKVQNFGSALARKALCNIKWHGSRIRLFCAWVLRHVDRPAIRDPCNKLIFAILRFSCLRACTGFSGLLVCCLSIA